MSDSSGNPELELEVESSTFFPSLDNNILFTLLQDTKVYFIVLLVFVILVYVIIFSMVSSSTSTESTENTVFGKSIAIVILELLLWVSLIIIIYVNIKNYSEQNYDFQASLENLFDTRLSELKINVQNSKSNNSDSSNNDSSSDSCTEDDNSQKEVFHIAENKFDYLEAREICQKYGARLATYDEIEKAYDNGANWCNYGWSEDQMIFFPTQKRVYNLLKRMPDHKNSCGRPGINGGYIHNGDAKFGANCYGHRPNPKTIDKHYMHSINHTPQISDEDVAQANRENNNISNYVVAPFNKTKWSTHK